MDVVVVGSGAVGTLLAATLARGGARVHLVRRRHAGPPAEEELVLVDPRGERLHAAVTVIAAPGDAAAEPDVVVLAVKVYDLEAALAALPAWPGATLLTVQNGIGAEALALAARSGGARLAGSLTASVALGPDGRVTWRRRGGIGLATVRGDTSDVLAGLATAWAAAGLPVRPVDDWAAMKWSKLVGNLVGNATSALLDRDPATIYRDPDLFRLEREQLREALAVMRRLKLRPVALPGANIPALALLVSLPPSLARPVLASVVGRARGGKAPSLRLHLGGPGGSDGPGGPTEARWLNGAVAAEGARLGVPTPVNTALARLVEQAAADPAVAARLRADPARLWAEVSSPPALSPEPSGRGAPGAS